MSGNSQYKLSQVRKPRVHITLDVTTEGNPTKELPFVVGVMGDFTGDPRLQRKGEKEHKPLPSFKERDFVQIDRDNFDKVMARMSPGLTLSVDNKLSGRNKAFQADLRFDKLEDFHPAKVAAQVPQLQALLESRAKLQDLLSKADRSDKLGELLETILKDEGKRKSIAEHLGPVADTPTTDKE